MRRIRQTSQALLVWPTAAMTVVGGATHFVCGCGTGDQQPRRDGVAKCRCCCGSNCASSLQGVGKGDNGEAGKTEPDCCCHPKREPPRRSSGNGYQSPQPRCLLIMVPPQDVSAPPVETTVRKDLTPSQQLPCQVSPLPVSGGIFPGGPTPWLFQLLPPPTNLVISLQHFLI